jgi:hypothetical protein
LNPVRARIVKKPEEYVWSGHLSYLGRGGDDLFDEGFVLDQFSKNRTLARQRYREFVWEGIRSGHQEKYYEVKDQRYLGEDSSIHQIEVGRRESKSWVYDVPLEAICREVSRVTGIREDRLYSATREREGAHGRGLVAHLAKTVSDYMVKEIADHFKRSPVTIGERIIKVEDLLGKDKRSGNTLTFMGENLMRAKLFRASALRLNKVKRGAAC